MLQDKTLETRKNLLQQKQMLTEEQLNRLFREKFSPETLKSILDKLFNLWKKMLIGVFYV